MSDEVSIRTAVPDDLPELQRIYREASLSNWGDRDLLLQHPEVLVFVGSGIAGGHTLVAALDDRIVGFATAVEADSSQELELEDLFVDPSWHRRGIARRLIEDLVRAARSDGSRAILVTGNPHAKAFYLSVGFVERGQALTEFGLASRYRLDLT